MTKAVPLVSTCPNCLEEFPVETPSQTYCAEPSRCYAEADAVRYARAKAREYDGQDMPEDIAFAIERNRYLAWETVGYDKHRRQKARKFRAAAFERDGGLCVLCGAPGTEVDHVDRTDSNELENLRLLCSDCHGSKTFADYGHLLRGAKDPGLRVELEAADLLADDALHWDAVPDEERARMISWMEHMAWYEERVAAEVPLRACDEPRWNWRAWNRDHRRPLGLLRDRSD